MPTAKPAATNKAACPLHVPGRKEHYSSNHTVTFCGLKLKASRPVYRFLISLHSFHIFCPSTNGGIYLAHKAYEVIGRIALFVLEACAFQRNTSPALALQVVVTTRADTLGAVACASGTKRRSALHILGADCFVAQSCLEAGAPVSAHHESFGASATAFHT